MKKITSMVLCVVMVMSLLAIPVCAEDASVVIAKSGSTITATYTGNTGSNNVIILAAYNSQNGKLRSVSSKALSSGKTVSLNFENGRTYKAFVMNKASLKPLCENAFYGEDSYTGTVEVPMIDGAQAEAFSNAIREYTDARLLLDELIDLDISDADNSAKRSEYLAKVDEAMSAYEDVLKTSAALYYISDNKIKTQSAEIEEIEDNIGLYATKDEQLHWAERLTEMYDSVKGGNKIKQLAQMLGCDAATAYEQLVASQDILRGKYMADAQTADNWVKGLTVVKTASKVGLVVGATIATAGAGGATLTGATGLWLGTADAVIDVGKTTATVIYGDDSKIVSDYEKFFAPITTASTIFSVCTLGSASPGEVIACLGDLKQTFEEKTGFSIDRLSFELSNGKLVMDVIKENMKKEDFELFMKDPAFIGSDKYDRLLTAKDYYDLKRDEVTDEAIEKTLKDADILDNTETLSDFKDEQNEFEKLVKTKAKNPDDEEEDETPPPKPTPVHTGNPTPKPTPTIEYIEEYYYGHLIKHYVDHSINKDVGTYEDYWYNRDKDEWVLVSRDLYDKNGNKQSSTSYDGKTGKMYHYYSWTDGENPGSIHTNIQYYSDDFDGTPPELPEGVTEQMQFLYQMIYFTDYDDNGKEIVNVKPYFGDYYEYDIDGAVVEHSTGLNGNWYKTEGFDKNGKLCYDYVDNLDGTFTYNTYFTTTPIGGDFNPTGHLQSTAIYKNGDDCGWGSNGVPYANSAEYISSEEWYYGGDTEILSDGGKYIGYIHYHGFNHHFNSTKNHVDGDFCSPHTGYWYKSSEIVLIGGSTTHYE